MRFTRALSQAKVVGKLLPQLKKAGDAPLAVIVGDDEIKAGIVKVKWLNDSSRKDVDVPRADFAATVARFLAELPPAPSAASTSTAAASSSDE